MSRKRIYREDYIEYGFTSFMDKGIEKPQCVICLKILCTESMKESKLRDHLNRAHPMLLSKPRQFFERHADMNKIQRLDTPGKECIYDRRDASYASYEVAWLIARNQKPYTIGEQLIKPAAVVMTRLMCGSEQAKKLELIPLSNDTITRRIKDMSIGIKQQLIARVHKSVNFAIQLDETTDIANNAQLMVYVRYQGAQDLEEDTLFCQSLDTTTRGIDIFTKTNNFFQDKENQLEWDNCVAVCSDGAPSMLGVHVGFVSYVKEVNPNIIITHCMIHREALVARELQPELHAVMKDVIKIVNYIKSSALNSRLFESLCNDIGSEHVHLLYYSETRWLSRGNVLCRVYELQSEISIFLKEKNHKLAGIFTNMEWLSRLCYLVDEFEHLNLLNITLQGRNENLVTVGQKITAFRDKLGLWRMKMKMGKIASFPRLGEFLEESSSLRLEEIRNPMLEHLDNLQIKMLNYFHSDFSKWAWIRDPFNINIDNVPDSIQEDLLEIRADQKLKTKFETIPLSEFYITLEKEHPQVSKEAIKRLIPFATTYLCEAGFSILAAIKTKQRNRLDPENDIRCALTKIKPRIAEITKSMNNQFSH